MILVAGGAGFIGSHLCDSLLERGNQVICVDNLVTGEEKNIAHLLDSPNFTFIRHDISEPLPTFPRLGYIFHLASPASPVDYLNLPIETLLSNSVGTYNLLQLCKENEAGFLLASTSEIYGDPLEHPQKEIYWGNVNPIGPRSCYDESKRFAEAITIAFKRKYDLDVSIVRIFNTYGPRMRRCDGRVIPNFIAQAQQGKPLTIYGDGSQTRSFCYVSDLVEGLYEMMKSRLLGPVNLGNSEEYTMLELAQATKRVIGNNTKLTFTQLPTDDPKRRRPDISRALSQIGWKPQITLEQGLNETVIYFREGD